VNPLVDGVSKAVRLARDAPAPLAVRQSDFLPGEKAKDKRDGVQLAGAARFGSAEATAIVQRFRAGSPGDPNKETARNTKEIGRKVGQLLDAVKAKPAGLQVIQTAVV